MRTFYTLLLFSGVVSTLEWPLFIQRMFGPIYYPVGEKRFPVQLSTQPNCSAFLAKLRKIDFIVYNYGIDEDTPGSGRDLVNCLSTSNATEVRSKITEVLIAMPLVGEPKPRQAAFIELIEMLPNITEIRTSETNRAWDINQWLNDERYGSSSRRRKTRGPQVKSFTKPLPEIEPWYGPSYTFDECLADSIDYNAEPGKGIDRIYRAMTKCDNIRSLSISIGDSGCVISSNIDSFNFTEGDKFSPLDHLSISGYGWIPDRKRNDLFGEETRPDSLPAWKKAMDWSKLKSLDIARPPREFLDTFQGELHSLHSFKLRPAWRGGWESTFCDFDQNATSLREAYTAFIKALPPLKELSISGMGALPNVTEILQVHGATLQSLSIHEFEHDCRSDFNKTWTRPTLSIFDLEAINNLAPDLKHLELDAPRDQDWPWKFLTQVSKLQELISVALWFDLEDPREQTSVTDCYYSSEECTFNIAQEPQLTSESSVKVYQALRAGQQEQQLERAALKSGDSEKHQAGGLHYNLKWYRDYAPVTFECKSLLKGEECLKRERGRYETYNGFDLSDY